MESHESEVGVCGFDSSGVPASASLGFFCTFGVSSFKGLYLQLQSLRFYFCFSVGAAGTRKILRNKRGLSCQIGTFDKMTRCFDGEGASERGEKGREREEAADGVG